MRQPQVDDRVRLTRDVPELDLHCGDVGVVCSAWFWPLDAFEVEFKPAGLSAQVRTILLADQLAPLERPRDARA